MGRIKIILIAVLGALVLIAIIFFVVGYFKPKSAGILIDSNPASTIYINGEQIGRTRYESTRSAGEITIKLIPDSFEKPLAPFETKTTLLPGIKTIIQRDFAESDETSSGAIISFEKGTTGEVGVSIVSSPDATQVAIDGQIRGFTPLKTTSITAGEHIITVGGNGFKEKSINVRTYEGYQLTAFFKLAPGGEDTKSQDGSVFLSPNPSPLTKQAKEEVEILPTSTGFLRVRSEPSTLAKEIGQVEPGERYELLDQDDQTGWFKIKFKSEETEGGDEMGWISNQYAKKVVSTGASPSPKASTSPSAKPSPKP